MKKRRKNKYGNYKCEYKNMVFDSKNERDRFIFLEECLNRKKIKNLSRQIKFVLQNKYSYYDLTKQCNRKIGSIIYVADFVYEYKGYVVVEDFKGIETDIFKLKEKLLLKNLKKNQVFYKSKIDNIRYLPTIDGKIDHIGN